MLFLRSGPLVARGEAAPRWPHSRAGYSRVLRWRDANARRRAAHRCADMTWKRWAFTALSFAAVIGVSVFFILRWWRAGSTISLPPQAHLLAEAGIPTSSALVVLFAELFLEALSLGTVVLIVAIVFRHAGLVLGALVGVVGAYAAFVIGVGTIAVVLSRRHVGDAAPTWARRMGLGGKRWDTVQRWFAQVRSTVDSVKHIDLRWAAGAYLMSVVHVAM